MRKRWFWMTVRLHSLTTMCDRLHCLLRYSQTAPSALLTLHLARIVRCVHPHLSLSICEYAHVNDDTRADFDRSDTRFSTCCLLLFVYCFIFHLAQTSNASSDIICRLKLAQRTATATSRRLKCVVVLNSSGISSVGRIGNNRQETEAIADNRQRTRIRPVKSSTHHHSHAHVWKLTERCGWMAGSASDEECTAQCTWRGL